MDHRIEIVRSILKDDLRAALRIAELSQSVNISSSRLRHLFKAETGHTLAQHLKGIRLEEAQFLLRTTFLSVKEIMHHVGITNASHFFHDFRDAFGLTPIQCRAKSQKPRFD